MDRALKQLDIDYYLIGALARDVQLQGRHNIEVPRATRDIDIAILVNNEDVYKNLVYQLEDQYGFVSTDLPYRYKYKDGTLLDIIPFGAIESEDRTVRLQGKKVEELSTIGFQENLEFTEEIEFEDGFKIRVTSLSGICLLKFFAWGDQPHRRERDVNDINFILSKYTDIYIDEIFDKHTELLELDWELILPARILGRHIGIILKEQEDTKNKLTALLNCQLTEDSLLPEFFTRFNKKTITENINLIREIITGLTE